VFSVFTGTNTRTQEGVSGIKLAELVACATLSLSWTAKVNMKNIDMSLIIK
jgi:hypothetical protein